MLRYFFLGAGSLLVGGLLFMQYPHALRVCAQGECPALSLVGFGAVDNVMRGRLRCSLGDNTPPLLIAYAGSDSVQYSSMESDPFTSIVMHYTGAGICDVDALVRMGMHKGSQNCPDFACGYHFYIGRDGRVVQGAPLSKRTNHVKTDGPLRTTTGRDVTNSNALGVSLVCGELGETQAQRESAIRLVRMLQLLYSIPSQKIFAHPELQNNKDPKEGMAITKILRSDVGQGMGDDTFGYAPTKSTNKQTLLCKVDPTGKPETNEETVRRIGDSQSGLSQLQPPVPKYTPQDIQPSARSFSLQPALPSSNLGSGNPYNTAMQYPNTTYAVPPQASLYARIKSKLFGTPTSSVSTTSTTTSRSATTTKGKLRVIDKTWSLLEF